MRTIEIVQQELRDARAELAQAKAPQRLTTENIEDVDDVYQDHLEYGYGLWKEEMRGTINDLEMELAFLMEEG